MDVRGFTSLHGLGVDRAGALISARADATGEAVVIRILTPALTADPAVMRQMRHDMAVLVHVRAENLVPVLAVDLRAAAIVSESVPSATLARIIEQSGPLDLAAALLLFDECLAGVAALHAAGVYHRDVRPDAVIVAMSGAVLLRDAGVPVPPLRAGGRAGTPQYMAPELWAGRSPSVSTDLYAATAVFHEALTAQPPFAATDIAALAYQHERAPVPDATLPAPARALISVGLAKDPRERPSNAEQFRSLVETAGRSHLGDTWRQRGRVWLAGAAQARADDPLPSQPVMRPEIADVDMDDTGLMEEPEPGLRLGPGWRVWSAVIAAVLALVVVVVVAARALTSAPDQSPSTGSGQPLFTSTPSVDTGAPAGASASPPPSESATPEASTSTPQPTEATPFPTPSPPSFETLPSSPSPSASPCSIIICPPTPSAH